jgi:hypothetical protein
LLGFFEALLPPGVVITGMGVMSQGGVYVQLGPNPARPELPLRAGRDLVETLTGGCTHRTFPAHDGSVFHEWTGVHDSGHTTTGVIITVPAPSTDDEVLP